MVVSSPCEEPEYLLELLRKRKFQGSKLRLNVARGQPTEKHPCGRVMLKDAVLSEMQTLSAEDVAQSEARESLKLRLINVISGLFPTKPEWEDPEPIRKVLFEEFVIQ